MDTSDWQGRCSTFSTSVLQPATHFLSAGRSHGSDFWQLGRALKNGFVVLLPPSHKHAFACTAEAATIIFTRSSLLGRARRARAAFVCCSPARKQIKDFCFWSCADLSALRWKKNLTHFQNCKIYIYMFACLFVYSVYSCLRSMSSLNNNKWKDDKNNFPDEREKGKVGWILDGIEWYDARLWCVWHQSSDGLRVSWRISSLQWPTVMEDHPRSSLLTFNTASSTNAESALTKARLQTSRHEWSILINIHIQCAYGSTW